MYKAARKGDVVAAGKDVAEDAITVASPGKSIGERVFAAVSLVSEISPVSISDGRDAIRWIRPLFKRLDKSGSLLETKGIDGLGSLLNASKFDKFIQSKGRALQFGNDGSASLAFDKLRKEYGVSSKAIKSHDNGARTFSLGNRTFTLRTDSKGGNTISVKVTDNPQQIVIRFNKE